MNNADTFLIIQFSIFILAILSVAVFALGKFIKSKKRKK